jgi:hypothetical protein
LQTPLQQPETAQFPANSSQNQKTIRAAEDVKHEVFRLGFAKLCEIPTR